MCQTAPMAAKKLLFSCPVGAAVPINATQNDYEGAFPRDYVLFGVNDLESDVYEKDRCLIDEPNLKCLPDNDAFIEQIRRQIGGTYRDIILRFNDPDYPSSNLYSNMTAATEAGCLYGYN